MNEFNFYIAGVSLNVSGVADEVLQALRTAFYSCTFPLVPATRHETYTFDKSGQALRNGQPIKQEPGLEGNYLAIEKDITNHISEWARPAQLIHAAALGCHEKPILFLGDSGAGKSTLSHQAVEAGFSYFSDDLTFFHDSRIFGVPRAIRFEPVPWDWEPAPYLKTFDLQTCRYVDEEGYEMRIPVYRVDPHQVPRHPLSSAQAWLFFLKRDASTWLEPLSAPDALARLYAAFIEEEPGDGSNPAAMISNKRSFVLHWSDPHEALRVVSKAVST